jgi:hypothetical protein
LAVVEFIFFEKTKLNLPAIPVFTQLLRHSAPIDDFHHDKCLSGGFFIIFPGLVFHLRIVNQQRNQNLVLRPKWPYKTRLPAAAVVYK